VAASDLSADPRTVDREGPVPTVMHANGRRSALLSALVIVGYVVLAVAAFWDALPGISGHALGAEGDFVEFIWFVGWVPHALAHGADPLWTNSLNVPVGVNLAQNTEAPFLGLLVAPVTLVFGPVVATNLLLLVGMPLSATAAFVVLRKWRVWRPAAAIGGLLYGFSPSMIGQSQGHPFLTFLPLPPLIALVVVAILRGEGRPRRLGVWLGLLAAAQYLISPEVFATVGVFTLLAVVCVAVRYPRRVGEVARNAARPFGLGLVVTVVLLAFPVWMLVAGPQHVSGPTFALGNPYHNDALSFVVPGPLQKLSYGLHSLEARVLGYSDPTEAGGFIGIPLLIVGGLLTWRSRRSPRMQLVVVLLAGAALLSLGPHLTVDGHATSVPLPFLVLGRLPLLSSILPDRINFEVDAFLAALVAFGLDDLRRNAVPGPAHRAVRRHLVRRRRAIGAAGVVIVALALTQIPDWPYATLTAPPLPGAIARAVPAGEPVTITYPYDTASVTEPMFWQATDSYRFRLIGGYVYTRAPDGTGTNRADRMDPPELQQFLAAQEGITQYGPVLPVGPTLVAATRATVQRYGIRQVIVDSSASGAGPVVALFTAALGPHRAASGTLVLWADWPGTP
jgi:hypothetical protein